MWSQSHLRRRFAGRPCAFSLIELLAVVAIVGILAAVLVPVLSKARATAAGIACLSNLRGFYLVLATDIQEHNNTLPLAYDSASGESWTQIAWSDRRYTKNDYRELPLFSCPLQLRAIGRTPMQTRTYSMNLVPTRTGINPSGNERRSIHSIPRPSSTVILADGRAYSATYYNPGFAYESEKLPEFLHGGKANFVFLDGHGESLREADLPPVKSAWPASGTREGFFWMGH